MRCWRIGLVRRIGFPSLGLSGYALPPVFVGVHRGVIWVGKGGTLNIGPFTFWWIAPWRPMREGLGD